jgi:hypothetical protein
MRCEEAQRAFCCRLHVIFSEEENFLIAHVKLIRCVSPWRYLLR